MKFSRKDKSKSKKNQLTAQQVIFDENSVIKNATEFESYDLQRQQEIAAIKKEKPQINQEKLDMLRSKFNFLRKIKPLRIRKVSTDSTKAKFDPRKADKNKVIDINSIWEKTRKQRTSEDKYYYRKEARTYRKYFFLYLSREVRRTRWTPRKQLNIKFWQTVFFITFFGALFALLQVALMYLFPLIKLS